MHWRSPHVPRRRFVSADGWLLIGLIWAAVILTIAGFKIVDLMQ